jgi:hypothetical protein
MVALNGAHTQAFVSPIMLPPATDNSPLRHWPDESPLGPGVRSSSASRDLESDQEEGDVEGRRRAYDAAETAKCASPAVVLQLNLPSWVVHCLWIAGAVACCSRLHLA